MASPFLSTQGKWKRSQSANTKTSTGQTSGPTLEQCYKNAHSLKQRRLLSSSSNNLISGCLSTPNPTSSPLLNGTNTEIGNVSDKNASNDDSTNANIPASSSGDASNKEAGINYDVRPASRQSPSYQYYSGELYMADNNKDREIEVGADNGTLIGAAVAIQQPDPVNSYLPEERMPEGGFL